MIVIVTGDVVEVWLIQVDLPDAMLASLRPLLDDAELSRADGYLRPVSRARYIAAHGAVRVILGRRLAVPPGRLRWRRGPHGKPELALPENGPQVSLSHSGGLAALALSESRRVGVDLQELVTGPDAIRLAERFYPRAEARFVARAPDPAEAGRRFTRLWARKEACVKVTGGHLFPGLALPARGDGAVVVAGPGGSPPVPCLVRDVSVPPGRLAAVAIEGAGRFRVARRSWPGAVDSVADDAVLP